MYGKNKMQKGGSVFEGMMDTSSRIFTPTGPALAAATEIAKETPKKPKKPKKDQELRSIVRQTKVDSTENISSKMKATARDATPPADEEYVNKKAGGYMKKMKKGGKTGKYTCSHNRLY